MDQLNLVSVAVPVGGVTVFVAVVAATIGRRVVVTQGRRFGCRRSTRRVPVLRTRPWVALLVTFAMTAGLLALSVANAPKASAHTNGAYSHDSEPVAEHPGWMAALPDTARLSELSIPGTHDSMAVCALAGPSSCGSTELQLAAIPIICALLSPVTCLGAAAVTSQIVKDMTQTQTMTLADQLKSGIRALDVRVRGEDRGHGEKLYLYHGAFEVNGEFETDVLIPIAEFLDENPSETVLLSVAGTNVPGFLKPLLPKVAESDVYELFEEALTKGNPSRAGTTYGDLFWDLKFPGEWTPNTSYQKGDTVRSPDGDPLPIYRANTTGRSASTARDLSLDPPPGAPGLSWSAENRFNPTLQETRGQVVLLQGYGGVLLGLPRNDAEDPHGDENSSSRCTVNYCVQGDYNYFRFPAVFDTQNENNGTIVTNWDIYEKWTQQKAFFAKADDSLVSDKIFINQLAAAGGAFPYFVASGHSSSETGASRLSTGLTTPGWDSSYPDFPRTTCGWFLVTICTISFEGMNVLAAKHLEDNEFDRVGIVSSDFPGKRLIEAIIAVNVDSQGKHLDVSIPNSPPTAKLDQVGYTGVEGTEITFDGARSEDPEDDPLEYEFELVGASHSCEHSTASGQALKDYETAIKTFEADNPSVSKDNLAAEFSKTPEGTAAQEALDNATFVLAEATFVCPDDDAFSVKLTVSDGIASDTTTATVTVSNVAPVITASGDVIDENGVATVSGTITDPGSLDTFDVVIDWGEGPPVTYPYPAGTTGYSEQHHYLDDNPTGTASDINPIVVTVTDDDGGEGTATATVTVNNVAPVITDIASSATFVARAAEGERVTVSGSFTDIGTLDTHEVLIDWDEEDGTTTTGLVTQGAGNGTFSGSHSYATGGVYTVVVTLTDDDTGATNATTTSVVIGVGLNDGELQIVGTDDKDHINVKATKKGNYIEVKTDFDTPKKQLFPLDNVTSLLALSFAGDDHIHVNKKVTLPATLDGGHGNDHLEAGDGPSTLDGGSGRDHLDAGDGPTVMLGGSGHDKLKGGTASDLLIGGLGEDDLKGNDAGDILIGGTTSADGDHSALAGILAAWTSDGLFTATVLDDGASDKLDGGKDSNWYFADLDGLDGDDDTVKLKGDDLLMLL